jgi:type I restriction enzyme S subunit
MDKTKNKIPALRFPEFEGEWNECKLGKVINLKRGYDLPKRSRMDGNVPIISSSGITGYHNEEKVKGPGIVTGRYGTIGSVFYLKENFWPLNTSLYVQDFKGNHIKFVYFLLRNFDFGLFSDKSAVPGINRNHVHEAQINLPILPEQQKIADFLTAVDDKINQLTRKKTLMEQYKKGVMQKIFSQEIRFPEFEGEWDEKKLGDISKIRTGDKDTKDKKEDGAYPFFVRSDNVERIDSYGYSGEAILTSGDGVGVGKNFHYINGKFNFHQRVYCIHDFELNVIGKYVFFYFSKSFFKRVIRMSAKNSVDSVRRDMVADMKIPVPTLPEQQKIADFLTGIDKKIELVNSQLEKTQEWKKGLLQQMFV